MSIDLQVDQKISYGGVQSAGILLGQEYLHHWRDRVRGTVPHREDPAMYPGRGEDIPTDAGEERKADSREVFQKLLESKTTDVFSKLVPIAGDVGSERLGLRPEDRQLLTNDVNVVIHSAATLDFEENLKPTAMVHVSSAYVSSYLKEAEEVVYESPADVESVIKLVEKLTDEALNDIER
ncbi:unnamed protein product, partial [Leptidea sinapis]